MNSDHTDPWESEMSREFDKRVRDLHEAPLTFDNVRGKAMTIRRNRRIAVAGGILAASAVIVPVTVLAGDGLGDSNDPIDPAGPSITQATDPKGPTPSETPVGVLGVDYLEGKTWRRADGSNVDLEARYDGGTTVDHVLLAVRNNNGQLTLDTISSDGKVIDTEDVWSYPVASADHTTFAYIDAQGALVFGDLASGGSVAEGLADGDSVVAVLDDRVYIRHGDGTPSEVVGADGSREVVPDTYKLNDVSADGRIAAQTSSSDSGSCSAVVEQDDAEVFATCVFSLDEFSPDEAHLSAYDAYGDGFGQGYVVILDSTTGNEVARWNTTEGSATTWVWEDDTHLLIQAYEQGEWRIYRLGVDGHSEEVLSSAEGDELMPAFTLVGVK